MTIPSAEKFFDVRITSRVEFADDLWMIRVDPGSQDFHFAPGQYATLGVDNGQGLIERAYSIVSSLLTSPSDPAYSSSAKMCFPNVTRVVPLPAVVERSFMVSGGLSFSAGMPLSGTASVPSRAAPAATTTTTAPPPN